MVRVILRPAVRQTLLSGTRTICGLAACFLLGAWTTGQTAAPSPAASLYRQAQARFDANDLSGASKLLEHVPKDANERDKADIANLRGAIDLRKHRYDQAQEEFKDAAAKDPHLWAARYNTAEVSFRRKNYDEASQHFRELLARTTGASQGRERQFVQYKLLLAELLAGREQPARAFLADHQGEKPPPPGYYYLTAALERKHGHAQKADQWVAQAGTRYSPGTGKVFDESFQGLGWTEGRSSRLAAEDGEHPARPANADAAPAPSATAPANQTPATVAMVEVMPGHAEGARKPTGGSEPARPAFRTEADHAPVPTFRTSVPAVRDMDAQMPPLIDARQPQTLVEDAAEARGGVLGPAVLGKPSTGRKPKATPTPSAEPSASPATGDSPAATPDTTSQPAGSPAPAFVQKYEAAYVKYLEKDYAAAKGLLDEADAIQPNQKSSADLRDLIFKAYYEGAYVSFRKGDFTAALEQLANGDGVKPSNPDSLNLRGLVLSRQRDYEHAEAAFKKASQLDPTFYAAKFNYAELPFNYRNYTVARTRFEELFSQTDPVKQPVEAEITQFKVFLTLLLEGKIDQARQFMDHFNFTGATPARYFCQAALDFYGGNMEKAQGWIDSAGKEFKPQLVSIFKESFYRIGWMSDVNGQAALAAGGPPPLGLPAASPTAAPAAASPGPVVATAAIPAAVLALNNATPAASVPASPLPAASATPAPTATPTPTAKPTASVVASAPSPVPTPVKPPAAIPTPTPVPSVAVAAATAVPKVAMPSAASLPTVAATPRPTVATPPPATPGPTTAVAEATPTPEETPAPSPENADETAPSSSDNLLSLLLIGVIVLPTLTNILLISKAFARRKERMLARRKASAHRDGQKATDPEEAQTPR